MHVPEPKVTTCVPVGQPFVIESEEMQYCRVQVVDVNRLSDCLPTEFVGFTVGSPPFTPPPTRQIENS